MSSLSSGVNVSAQLTATLKNCKGSSGWGPCIVKVQIKNDFLEQVGIKEGPPQKDLSLLKPMLDKDSAAYFLVKTKQDKWTFISWVPETVLHVKEKMLYASTHDVLKRAFGQNMFEDDLHATAQDDLKLNSAGSNSIGVTEAARKELLSRAELAREEATEQENVARKEQIEIATENKGGIGGYHKVTYPFSTSLNSALGKFKSGSVNFIELRINQTNNEVEAAVEKNVGEVELERIANKSEPRFYLYNPSSERRTLFVYLCPGNAPTKLRMVYSTAKPAVISGIQGQSINIQSKLEISELADFTHSNLIKEARSISVPSPPASPISPSFRNGLKPISTSGSNSRPGGNSNNMSPIESSSRRPASVASDGANSSEKHIIVEPHAEVRALFPEGVSKGSGRKKVILPPPGAYC